MSTGKHFSKESLLRVAELLFLAACGCYFIHKTEVLDRFLSVSTAEAENILVYILLAFAVLRLVLLWPEEKKLILGACALAVVMAIINFRNGGESPGAFAVIILGCAGLRFERLARMHAVIWVWYTLGMIFGCLTGFFSVHVRFNGGDLRSAWGFSHPNATSAYVVFSVLFLWGAFSFIPDWIFLLLSLLPLWIGLKVTYSDTGVICSILLAVLILFHMIPVNKLLATKRRRRLLQGMRMLLSLSFPLLAAAEYFLIRLYAQGNSFALAFDQWMTGRLRLALEGFREFGVPLFGSEYRLNAYAGANYNVIDSLYSLAIVRYGWLFLAAMAAAFVFFSWRCFQNDRRRVAYGAVLASVYCLAENTFEIPHVNLYFCMAFCSLLKEPQAELPDTGRTADKERRPARIAAGAAVAAVLLMVILFLPKLFSCMRTVYLQFGWVGKDEKVFLLVGAAFLVLGVFLACVYRVVYALWRKERPSKSVLVVTGVCCILFAFSAMKLRTMVRTERANYASVMEELRPAMEVVQNASQGQVIPDTLPEVFGAYFPGMTRSWRRAEELAWEKNTTLITSRWTGQQELTARGYRFLQLSEIYTLYTNDTSVVQALRDAGYHIASYDYSVSSVLYSGPENEYQGVPVLPEAEGGTGGFVADLNGVYTVSFDLNFRDGRPQSIPPEEELCTLRVWSVNNDSLIAERVVLGGEVGESGWNTYDLRFSCGRGQVVFSVLAGDAYPMRLTEIRYQRTPDYDVFDTTDEAGRLIRREYYDLEGNRVAFTNGASVIEYEYDEAGNNTVQYFFDTEEKPLIITNGFAGLHRTFDEEKRVIHEHYTGTEGEPLMISGGYAAYEVAYDAAGNGIIYRYYDTEGNLVMLPGGYALLYRDFNENKQMIRQRTIDTVGNPAVIPAGYAMHELGYDAAGNATDYYYYDRWNCPVMTTSGYAELHRTFDEAKRIIRESYADTEGNPVTIPAGYAAYEAEYDAAGNANVYRYYGADGKPALIGDGYAELHRVFDEKKQITEESYFDGDGKPVMLTGGYAVDEREYDAAGNLITQRFYDTARTPVLTANGIFEIRRQYDDAKRLLWEEYADTEGNPAARPDGVWAFARVYGEDGKVSEEVYYDIDGQLFTP